VCVVVGENPEDSTLGDLRRHQSNQKAPINQLPK
jgi:hypothetical protein